MQKETAFIMMLHQSDEKAIKQAFDAKVSQCLTKPYSGNTVLEKIAEVLG
jgi:CheY-like chemotaxis protein